MRFAYKVDNVQGRGAFTPLAARSGIFATASLMRRAGNPGIVAEPASGPRLSPLGWDPAAEPSNVAPNVILPSIYIAFADNMGPWATPGALHVAWRHGTVPVPAQQIVHQPRPAARRARIGGRRVVPTPRVLPTYPSG